MRMVADLPVVLGAVVERLEGVQGHPVGTSASDGGGGEDEGGLGGVLRGLRELRERVLRGRGVVEGLDGVEGGVRDAGDEWKVEGVATEWQKGGLGDRCVWHDQFWTIEVD